MGRCNVVTAISLFEFSVEIYAFWWGIHPQKIPGINIDSVYVRPL